MKKIGTRARLTAIAVLVIAVVVLVAGLMLMIVQQRLLTDNLDQTLRVQSTTLERDFLAGTLPQVLEEKGTDDLVAQVVYADTVLASTPNMEGQPALSSPDGDVRYDNTTLAIDYRRYRLLSRRVGDVVIHTGTPINQVERATDALRTALAVGIPTVTLLLGVLAWVLIGRVSRPPVTPEPET